MIYELTNTAGTIELNKWYRIYDLNGDISVDSEYIRFIFAWRLTGEKLYVLPAGETVYVNLEYCKNRYP